MDDSMKDAVKITVIAAGFKEANKKNIPQKPSYLPKTWKAGREIQESPPQQQTLPMRPAPYARQRLTEEMLTNRTPEAHRWALEKFRSFISNGQFVPFSVDKDTVVFPGFDGGAEWGGCRADAPPRIRRGTVPWRCAREALRRSW